MAAKTKIEWATEVWNPLLGCTRVGPGCDFCYAVPQARIRASNPHPRVAAAFADLVEKTDHGLDWTGNVNLLPERLTQPLRWKKPRRIFVNSLSDLFHAAVPVEYIAKVFAVMSLAPQHTFLVLTKRHGRMRSVLADPGFEAKVDRALLTVPEFADAKVTSRTWPLPKAGWPLPNVHLGVSVENQHWADIRIPALLDTPAAVRWISAEPLLGPVRLSAAWVNMPADARPVVPADILGIGLPTRLDWVVAGGESGANARPSHPDWFRSLRDQCTAADVPFFFKQHGDWGEMWALAPGHRLDAWDEKRTRYVHPVDGRTQSHGDWNGRDHKEGWAVMQRVGKARTGRLLDGVEHDGYPKAVTA